MRWATVGAIYLSLGILLFGAALFYPRGGLFADSSLGLGVIRSFRWLPLFLGTLFAGALGRRFPRAAGISLVGVFIFLSVFMFLSLGSFHTLPEGRAMEYRILRTDDESTVVRLGFENGREVLLTLQGRGIHPVVEQITAPKALFLIPERRLYRISRLQRDAPPGFLPLRVPSNRHPHWGNGLAWAAKTFPFLDTAKIRRLDRSSCRGYPMDSTLMRTMDPIWNSSEIGIIDIGIKTL